MPAHRTQHAINSAPETEGKLLPPCTFTPHRAFVGPTQHSYIPAWISHSEQMPYRSTTTQGRTPNEPPRQQPACLSGKNMLVDNQQVLPRSEEWHPQHTAITALRWAGPPRGRALSQHTALQQLCTHRMKAWGRKQCQRALTAVEFHFLVPAPRPAHIPAAAQASAREGIRAACSILKLGQTGERKPTSHPHAVLMRQARPACALRVQKGGGMTSCSSYESWRV